MQKSNQNKLGRMNSLLHLLLSIARDVGYKKTYPFTYGSFNDIDAFGQILPKMDPSEYFNLLKGIIDYYPNIKNDKKYLEGYIYLIEYLAHRTGTTEIPGGLKKIINDNDVFSKGLKKYYRI